MLLCFVKNLFIWKRCGESVICLCVEFLSKKSKLPMLVDFLFFFTKYILLYMLWR